MTLFRQLVATIVVLFLVVFSVTLLVNLNSSRTFLQEQLVSHAQDTATSLGLSISTHLRADDLPAMESMVNAVFDRGYYRRIELRRMDGTPVVVRELEVRIEGVPEWFIRWLPLEAPSADALVMSGWNQVGTVTVESHPGYAYAALWDTARQLFAWYAGLALAAMLTGWLVLRLLFRPLLDVERQAEAICARNYDMRIPLPHTRELRRVVVAMNNMTGKVKAMFEEQARATGQLQRQAYSDPVTGLGNRRYFSSQAESRLGSGDEAGGVLFIVQIEGVEDINQTRGYAAGDEFLRAAADVLTARLASQPGALVARLSGAAFGMMLPGLERVDAESVAVDISTALAALHAQGLTESSSVAHLGGCLYRPGGGYHDIMAEADRALSLAQSRGANTWHCTTLPVDTGAEVHGGQEWHAFLETVVREGRFELHSQPVVAAGDPDRVLHREILVRVTAADGSLRNAGIFMPMAERRGLATAFDRAIVERVLGQMNPGGVLAVNLSPVSLEDEVFLGWLETRLEPAATGGRLIFEVPEFGATRSLEALMAFTRMLQARGHGIAVDHFGRGFANFGYLRSLRPEYVKIDSAYTRNVGGSQDDQFFVGSLCRVAHSLDIDAIAEAVESEAEWAVLRDLNVDGIQGYAAGRPAPM